MAGPLQQRGERVAIRRAPPVADVERPRGIGRDELDVDLEADAELASAVGGPALEDLPHYERELAFRQPEVDEAGPGDLDFGDQRGRELEIREHPLGYLPRLRLVELGEHHGQVGG